MIVPRLVRLCSVLLLALVLAACTESPPEEDGPLPPPPGDSGVEPKGERFVGPDIQVGPPVAVSVATWNVKDFFDTADDPLHDDTVLSETDATAKLKAVAAGIKALNVDLMALQEVENLELLNRLNTQELASLGYKQVVLFPANDIRGINVALLSRLMLVKTISHAKDRFKGLDGTTTFGFSRDCLEVVAEAGPGRQLTLLINHFAATTDSESILRREAQAARVRAIVDEILKWKPQANVAVVGDLNDDPASKAIQLLVNGTPALFNLLSFAPAAERYTFAKEQLDYILVSPGLKSDYQSGTVKADHQTLYKNTSDHYPVTARFTIE